MGVGEEKKEVVRYHNRKRGICPYWYVVCSTPLLKVGVHCISVYMEPCLTFYYVIMCNFFIVIFKKCRLILTNGQCEHPYSRKLFLARI